MQHGIRTCTDQQLQALRNKALYRGLDATAQAVKREQLRRLDAYPLLVQAA